MSDTEENQYNIIPEKAQESLIYVNLFTNIFLIIFIKEIRYPT